MEKEGFEDITKKLEKNRAKILEKKSNYFLFLNNFCGKI